MYLVPDACCVYSLISIYSTIGVVLAQRVESLTVLVPFSFAEPYCVYIYINLQAAACTNIVIPDQRCVLLLVIVNARCDAI